LVLLGMMKGNMAAPAVMMIPVSPRLLITRPNPGRLAAESTSASPRPAKPSTGKAMVQG
jgi:hypothetical protein